MNLESCILPEKSYMLETFICICELKKNIKYLEELFEWNLICTFESKTDGLSSSNTKDLHIIFNCLSKTIQIKKIGEMLGICCSSCFQTIFFKSSENLSNKKILRNFFNYIEPKFLLNYPMNFITNKYFESIEEIVRLHNKSFTCSEDFYMISPTDFI
jgi:hypothetical protein